MLVGKQAAASATAFDPGSADANADGPAIAGSDTAFARSKQRHLPSGRPGDNLYAMSDDVEQQQALNRGTWTALQEHGFSAGDPLTVDAFFFAPSEASSVSLAADLRTDGWKAEAHAQKAGLLRRRTTWSVQATRRIASVDLQALDGMVEVLARRAQEHGAVFDGWARKPQATPADG